MTRRIAIFTAAPGIGDFIVRVPAIKMIADHFQTTLILSLPESWREFAESYFPDHRIEFIFTGKYQKSYLDRFFAFASEMGAFWKARQRFHAVFLMSDFNTLFGVAKLTVLAYLLSPSARKFSIRPDRISFPGFRNIVIPRLMHKRQRYKQFSRQALADLGITEIREIDGYGENGPRRSTSPKRIALIPGSKMPSRRWPFYADLLVALARRYSDGVEFFVVGSRDETGLIQSIAGTRAKACIGLPLIEIKRLLSDCEAVICNDSGLMHLSVSVGTETVALCGGEIYEVWCDYKETHYHPLRHMVECYPCRKWDCSHKSCLAGISVGAVMDRIGEILDQNATILLKGSSSI